MQFQTRRGQRYAKLAVECMILVNQLSKHLRHLMQILDNAVNARDPKSKILCIGNNTHSQIFLIAFYDKFEQEYRNMLTQELWFSQILRGAIFEENVQ